MTWREDRPAPGRDPCRPLDAEDPPMIEGIGVTETIPAEPGGGGWVIEASILRGPRREAVALFGVMLADGGLVWSTSADRATTFLTSARAVDVIRAGRRRGDVWTGVARVRPERLDAARRVARLSIAGVLGEA